MKDGGQAKKTNTEIESANNAACYADAMIKEDLERDDTNE